MKGFAFALAVLCVVVLVETSPAKFSAPKCDIACTQDYIPICGAPPNNSSKPRLFSNDCVLSSFNCQHKTNWTKVSNDQCKNVGGVLLS